MTTPGISADGRFEMSMVELQIDRLVGPTHHFGGLGVGNIASQRSAGHLSNPAAAAIQGLDKMRLVAGFGAPQMILAPQPRPNFGFLRSLGFAGTDLDLLKQSYDQAPELLSAAASCSAIWTANAATVTPGVDSDQPSTHVTIANLCASIHRAIEPAQTESELRCLLASHCSIHSPLPGGTAMRDEGAANHMRLGTENNEPGINLFVYGDREPSPRIHYPRQTRAACEAVARLHRLAPQDTFFLKQHPDAIDAGAFHNDVVAISHHNLLIYHQRAFQEDAERLEQIESRFQRLTKSPLIRVEIPDAKLSLDDAVATYLFNSQVVSSPTADRPVLICTTQVKNNPTTHGIVSDWCREGIFADAKFVDLRQSMSGGGGPACLRLRVPLPATAVSTAGNPRWSEAIDDRLRQLILSEYPKSLSLAELIRPDFHQHALHTVSRIRQTLETSDQG